MNMSAILIILLFANYALCENMMTSPFTRDVICDVRDRIDNGCSRKAMSSRRKTYIGLSMVKCVAICASNQSCMGASLSRYGICILHGKCPELAECIIKYPSYHYMTRYCVHGNWNSATHSCDCVDFSSGERCNEYIKHCGEMGVTGERVILIDPDEDGRNPLRVLCRVHSPDNWAILMMQNYGNMSFDRSWEDYKWGFYGDIYNMWGGLEVWHRLSTKFLCTKMKIAVNFKAKNHKIKRLGRIHQGFVVAGESTGYAFTFHDSIHNVRGNPPPGTYCGDCLAALQKIPFSTLDKDEDGNKNRNCASRAGSAWWYDGCDNPCNLLGYGFEHWSTKTVLQRLSVKGVDMNEHGSEVDYVSVSLKCQDITDRKHP